jgi:CDGSH-type Zn-finger protein
VACADEVIIVPYQDGPYLVRGPVSLRDQGGMPIATLREPIALCRCGKSRMRPFCDGTHQLVRFQAPSEPELPATLASPRHAAGTPSSSLRHRVAQASAAARALQRAQEILMQALRNEPPTVDAASIRSAQSLVLSARVLLDGRAPEGASGEGARFLIQGARHALAALVLAGDGLAARATADLQRAAADLESRS